MSSPSRCPKDLKTIVNGNKMEEENLAMNFEKLNKLSHDDHNEIAMLRSRIDEQSKLICILKQRADEYIIKNQALETMNSDFRSLNEQIEERYREERKRANLIDMRFNELASNHEEMIKFKDQHKARNRQLLKENQQLREDNKNLFSAAIKERDETIQSQTKEINSLQEKLRNTIAENERQEKEINSIKFETNKKIRSLSDQVSTTQLALTDAEQKIADLKRKVAEIENNKITGLEKLKQEQEDLVQQVMQRGKLLQDRQHQVDKLEEDLVSSRRETEEANSRFMIMEARVNANTRVKSLQSKVDESNQELYRMKMEFEAFRVHSNNLLSREKELNKQLRHNIG